MDVTFFTESGEVLSILNEAKNVLKLNEKQYSDITDDEGLQYVDFVQEGGGVLGIALVGYMFVLEELGIRFLQLGGASAGAINTLLLAASGPINNKKSEWIIDKLANKNLNEFVDGDDDAVDFINTALGDSGIFKLAWKGMQVIDNLKDYQGLNPGNNFKNWIAGCLNEKNIKNLNQLYQIRNNIPTGLKHSSSDGELYLDAKRFTRFGLIAADITTETKAELPRMAGLYWENPEDVNPAEFARASMSVPVFFHPYILKNIPVNNDYETTWKKWEQITGYKGGPPKEVKFMDGGIVSNFPIDMFHNHTNLTPTAPTFGVKLQYDRMQAQNTSNIFSTLAAMFNTSRHIHDYQFILKHPDYKHLVAYINTGNVNWLNFNISDSEQLQLFIAGAREAVKFLVRFDWEKYKILRMKINPNC